jgi:hypothetical protein
MIVGVLTTCHTQYIWYRSICIFYLIEQQSKFLLHTLHAGEELSQSVHGTATYRCDDTRGCTEQFLPPDNEHMCSKHVEE